MFHGQSILLWFYVVRYEIALGTTPGGSQIREFTEVPLDKFRVVIDKLDLTFVREVFATVKGYNEAELFSTETSSGVYISRVSSNLPSLDVSTVWDGLIPRHDR